MMKQKTKYVLFLLLVLVISLFTTQGIFPSTASSAFLATTTDGVDITLTVTEAVTPPTPPGGGGGGPPGYDTVEIINVETIVATNTATVLWETTRPAVSTFSWGLTTEYSDGTLQEISLSEDHLAVLNDLTPDSLYYFFIEVDDITTGIQGYAGVFRTLPIPDIQPPTNISNFQAVGTEDSVDLTWNNPLDEDFDLVRIVRSVDFFPLSPTEGKVVYEGRGTEGIDTDVEQGVTYYYSAFALDESGNPSEGSIALGRLVGIGEPPEIIDEPLDEFPPAPEIDLDPLFEKLSLLLIDFIQDGKKIPHTDNRVNIDGSKDLTISIDYERLPEILKTVAFTIADPEDQSRTFSFLLRVTPDKKTYRTTIAPFVKGGVYEFDVNILDHKNQGVKKLDGEMLVAAAIVEVEMFEPLRDLLLAHNCLLLLILLLLVLLISAYLRLYKKMKNRKLFFVVATSILLVIVFSLYFNEQISDQYFCYALILLLLILIPRSMYQLLKRIFKK